MKRFFFGFLLFTFYYLLFTVPASAAGNAAVECQPIYGGGVTCPQPGNLAVDKKVQHRKTASFLDNIDINDPNDGRFSPDEQVRFKVTVQNTGNSSLSNVTFKDIIPQFVTFVAGEGNFDANTKTLSVNIGTLNAGQKRDLDIVGKIVSSNQLPNDKGVVCVVNQAMATVSQNGQTSQDNAQFCIEKKVLAEVTTKGGLKVFPAPQVTTTPPTGPEMIPLIALLPGGLAGIFLRRKTKNSAKIKK